jgi:hypothetical protein
LIDFARNACFVQGFNETRNGPLTGFVISVKKLNQDSLQGHNEWLAEVNCLGQLHPPNFVKLMGYCTEDDHRLLVYEFSVEGELENQLFRRGSTYQTPFLGHKNESSHWSCKRACLSTQERKASNIS